jgi:hypothetical protein
MDGEKLPPFIIYKRANTTRSLIKLDWKELEERLNYGYPEGQVYTIKEKAWMDEQAMMKWDDEVWVPYTKDHRRDGQYTYLLHYECCVHLMGSVNNQIDNRWTVKVP